MKLLAKVSAIASVLLAIGVIAADQACFGRVREAAVRLQALPPGCCAPRNRASSMTRRRSRPTRPSTKRWSRRSVPRRYVEATEYKCVPATVMQPKPRRLRAGQVVQPLWAGHGPEMCRLQILRKVPYTVFRERALPEDRRAAARGRQAGALHLHSVHSEGRPLRTAALARALASAPSKYATVREILASLAADDATSEPRPRRAFSATEPRLAQSLFQPLAASQIPM